MRNASISFLRQTDETAEKTAQVEQSTVENRSKKRKSRKPKKTKYGKNL